MTIRDGIPIEGEYGDTHHVLKDNGLIYSVSLTNVDLTKNKNSFYKLQALMPDRQHGSYICFSAWGRQNVEGGGTRAFDCVSKADLIDEFERIYGEKTGNVFGMYLVCCFGNGNGHVIAQTIGEPFVKKPNKYNLVETHVEDYSRKSLADAGSNSTLPQPIQDLIRLIFDAQLMRKVSLCSSGGVFAPKVGGLIPNICDRLLRNWRLMHRKCHSGSYQN